MLRASSFLSLLLALGGCGLIQFQATAPSARVHARAGVDVRAEGKATETRVAAGGGAAVRVEGAPDPEVVAAQVRAGVAAHQGGAEVRGGAAARTHTTTTTTTVRGQVTVRGQTSAEGHAGGQVDDPFAGDAVPADGADGAAIAGRADAGGSVMGGAGGTVTGAAGASVDASGASADFDADIAVRGDVVLADPVFDGTPGVAPDELGGGEGVRAIGRGRASISALLGGEGLDVDGYRVRLGDLGPLHPGVELDADSAATFATDGSLAAHAELTRPIPAGGGETDLVVRVQGGAVPPAAARPRLRVHLVIDRSSSMHSSWAEVFGAASELIGALHPQDTLQIVAYGGTAEEILPPIQVGDRRRALRALADMEVGGGTNIEAGLRIAYRAAARAPEARPVVLLLSDGVPTAGAFDAEEFGPLAAEARASGCATSVIGLGNQFDGDLLREVARAGGGAYHVAREASDLGVVLRAEVQARLRIAARDVGVHVALPEGVELAGPLPEGAVRVGAGIRLSAADLSAGEERRVRVKLRVRARVRVVARVNLGWKTPAGVTRQAERSIGSGEASAHARLAVADADLGHALDAAADHVLNGRGAQASAALLAHVVGAGQARVEGRLRVRTQQVARFATALETLTEGASHTQRREVSLAMGALAARLLR